MHWLQNHWSRITPLHLILFPISLVFRLLVSLRRDLYRNGMMSSEQLLVPVVVIGNINVGGTGKTPFTLGLAQFLCLQGWHPIIVSRGFGGTNKLPRQVDPTCRVLEVGDEPLLMARRNICPVWIGRNRAETALVALHEHPECDVVLCDDGLQHYRLRRDVEIVVIDSDRKFGNGLMLPAGPLREHISRLQKVDAVVVNGTDTEAGQYQMKLSGEIFYNLLDPEKKVSASHFYSTQNHAVAGIGNPQRFFKHLKTLGIPFIPHDFPDHHPFKVSELSFPDCDAILVTEKDAVKCTQFADSRYWVLRVDAQVDSSLLNNILRKIKTYGSKTA